MSFLEMRGVSKRFGKEVLRDVSLAVAEGELVSIVGASGAGKTTLLSILAGLLEPDAGLVRLGGRRVDGPGPDRAVVFQTYALLPWLDVFDNLALAVAARFPSWEKARQAAWIERHLGLVGLTDARRKRPRQLSGGMRQRAALARALAMDPAVLLLDEPLSALDALNRATLQEELERIFRESRKTIVLITNDIAEAVLLSDRVVPLVGSPSSLGESIGVPLGRPRRVRELHHDQAAQALRRQVMETLLASRRDRQRAAG